MNPDKTGFSFPGYRWLLQHGQNEKRQYTKYTTGQKVILWRAYAQNKFPDKQMEEELVRKLGLPTETGVKSDQNWFKNRRQRDRASEGAG